MNAHTSRIKPAGKRQEQAENVRRELLEAGRYLYISGAPINLAAAAKHAGRGVATAYRYFDNAEDFTFAVILPFVEARISSAYSAGFRDGVQGQHQDPTVVDHMLKSQREAFKKREATLLSGGGRII